MDRGAQVDRVKLDYMLLAIPDWAVSYVVRRNTCRLSCWAILGLQRQRSSVIGRSNGRDVLRLIGRIVWESRREVVWSKE
jgi:hypothetical protein